MGINPFIKMLCAAWLCALISACATSNAVTVSSAEQQDDALQLEDYRLGPSDRVRIIVFGEPDLSGEFSLNSRGAVSMPLLGDVDAKGLTIDELREKIASGFAQGYVNDAQVAAEVIEFRPYYILGEVGRPGEYPYSSGMTVIKAVAAAQGYTYRANKSVVFVKRADSDEEIKYRLTTDLMIYPGDVIRVGERFF